MGTLNSANGEWLELYNNSSENIDLTGWTLSAADNTPIIGLSGIMPAGGFFILERTNDDTLPGIAASQIYTGALGNSGENLELKDNSGNLIDSVDCSSGWFAGDNVTKQTMERKDPALFGNETGNWQSSQNPGGTPKSANSAGVITSQQNEQTNPSNDSSGTPLYSQPQNKPPLAEAGDNIIALVGQEIIFDGTKSSDPENKPLTYLWNFGDGASSDKNKINHSYKYPGTYIASLAIGDGANTATDTAFVTIYSNSIIISEFIPNPSGADQKAEWLELYNNSDNIADLSNWQIATQNEKSKPFAFPANTLLAPRQYLVLDSPTTKISLRNESGSLKLLYPNGQTAQEIKYDKAKENQSIALAGNNQYFWTSVSTPGAANIVTNSEQPTTTNSASASFSAQETPSSQTTNIISGSNLSQSVPEGTLINTNQAGSNLQQTNNANPSPLTNQAEKDSASLNPNENSKGGGNSTQTSSLASKISNPILWLVIIIIIGLLWGLGLVKTKRKLKARAQKLPIDWQD